MREHQNSRKRSAAAALLFARRRQPSPEEAAMGQRNVHVKVEHGWCKRSEPVAYVLTHAGAVAAYVMSRRQRCAGGRGSS